MKNTFPNWKTNRKKVLTIKPIEIILPKSCIIAQTFKKPIILK